MGRPHVTLAEQETILRWDEEEKNVNLYSACPRVWAWIEKRLKLEPYRTFTAVDGTITGKDFRMPLAEFRWGRKRRVVLSEAKRAQLAARMATARREKACSIAQNPIRSQESDGEVDE